MASPEADSKATVLPQPGISATYRPLNVPQNVQYVSPEEGYKQAAARATSTPPRLHAPPGSPVLSTESGNGLQDPGFPFRPLSTFPFDGLSMFPDGQFGFEDDPSVSNPSVSLRIGFKGESSFPHLGDFSRGAIPIAGSSPHSYSERECLASRDFTSSNPQIPPPPSSPYLSASLQELTLEGDTRNEEEFKMVDEIWDPNANEYKIREHPGSLYPLSVNRRFGKPDTEPKGSININSDGLRAIVLQALEDSGNRWAHSIFGEEGITIDLDVLLNCLPQLEVRLAIYTGFTMAPPTNRADAPGEHLKKLVKFLKPLREIDTPPPLHMVQVDEYLNSYQ